MYSLVVVRLHSFSKQYKGALRPTLCLLHAGPTHPNAPRRRGPREALEASYEARESPKGGLRKHVFYALDG